MSPSRTVPEVAPDTYSLTAHAPLPGLGLLPVSAFVIRARQPVLVDTGLAAARETFLADLESVIDPAELAWVWLSHMDLDHTGNLDEIVARAPRATFVTTFLGAAKLGLRDFDMSRVRVLQPGESLDVGDRTLVPVRPPYFDAPETMGFFDTRTRALFAGDAFGAPTEVPYETAADIPSEALFNGMAAWAGLDAPWLAMVDRKAFGAVLNDIRQLDPSTIITAHLPPARGVTEHIFATLNRVLDQTPGPTLIADKDKLLGVAA